MDVTNMLIVLLPVTAVLVLVALKFIFNSDKKGRDAQNNNQAVTKSSPKKDKKKPRKKIETVPVSRANDAGDSESKAKVSAKVAVKESKPAVKETKPAAKSVKTTKETNVTITKSKNVKIVEEKPIKSKKSKKSSESEAASDESWTTVAKKGKQTISPKSVATPNLPIVINDHISEKATLTIEEVLQLGNKTAEKEETKKIVTPKVEVKKVEKVERVEKVEKKKKKQDLVVPSVEDQLEDAMEEFETVKSRNRKNKKQNEDKPAKYNKVLQSPPSYEQSLTQSAQEKAVAAVTFDEMGSLEAQLQPKVKPSKKKKSRRD